MEEPEMQSRSYQSQIEEMAMKENTIVFLPTGSGKTFIAIQLIKRLQQSLQNLYSEGGKRTFFLANTIPLVGQHVKTVESLTALSVKGFTSQDKVDLWQKNQWLEQLQNIQVLIMTPQILCDMLLHGYIELERINLIIFDECHAAVKDHPMRKIMQQFENVPAHKTPKVLGLSATLINSNVNPDDVKESLRDLESTFHAKICTCDDINDVMIYSANPNEIVISYDAYELNEIDSYVTSSVQKVISYLNIVDFPDETSTNENLEEIFKPSKKKKILKIFKSVVRILEELGTYCGSIGIMSTIVKIERLKLSSDAQTEKIFLYCITKLVMMRSILEKHMLHDNLYTKIIDHSSSRLKALLTVLKEYSPTAVNEKKNINKNQEKMCCIIFVKERMTALTLHIFLKHVKQYDKDLEFLNHDFITGFNTNPYSDTREDLYHKKQNKIVVNKFRIGTVNCLITTDLLEEGFDLPQCNLIIRFDELNTFKSYIQSKGRGRHVSASYVIMIPSLKKMNFKSKLEKYQTVFENVNDMLIGKTHHRQLPSKEELSKVYETILEPYVYKNAKITVTSSISLLNNYCAKLTHDKFTNSSPVWFRKKVDDLTIALVKMPGNSPLKDLIESPPMSNIKEAKQVAALLACKELHKLGELNDNLLPSNRIKDEPSVQLLFPFWSDDEDSNNHESKLPKNQNYFLKEFPKCFKRSNTEISSDTYYLHHIDIKPKHESEDPQLHEIYKVLESRTGLSIITKNKMEQLCPFSVYLSSGEVYVNISHRNVLCTIPENLLENIKRFHVTVFFDVLKIYQRFLYLDNKCENNYFFVVPTNICDDVITIDKDTINKHYSLMECDEPSVDERKGLIVNKYEYIHSVISPWYRSDNSRYIVTEVCDYKTPHSPFGNLEYSSYADYFQRKHTIRILGNQNQPMLKVKHVGGSNCLLPRSISLANEQNISKKKLKSLEYLSLSPSYEEHLVPEFCVKFDFPGVLWLKAVLLPSILHRVTMLSQAEELRQKIAKETGLGPVTLRQGEIWTPLSADIHALKMSEKALLSESNESFDSSSSPDLSGSPERNVSCGIIRDPSLDFKFSKSNIDSEFPWNPMEEPINIERNLDTISIMDIECFEKFVNQKANCDEENTSILGLNTPTSKIPKRAICAPPSQRVETIKILEKTMSSIGPQLRSVLEALTISRCNDIINLERLETLGDSFLKFGCSIFLWHKYPLFNEGELTAVKGKLVSNKNLFYCAKNINLGGRMKTRNFKSSFGWLLPSFRIPQSICDLDKSDQINTANFVTLNIPREEVLKGTLSPKTQADINEKLIKSSDDEISNSLRDNSMESYVGEVMAKLKWVADSTEAIIGLYLLEGGVKSAFEILKWLGILPKEDIVDNLMKIQMKTPYSEKKFSQYDINFQLDFCRDKIEEILGYKFGDPSYLLQALSHSSNIKNNITDCYQRLEFVGDAILDFLITSHIYENFSSLGPGDITDLRSALVNNVTFACIIVRLGLHKYIQSSNTVLDLAILKFVQNQNLKGNIVDESVVFLFEEEDCNISDYVDVPKALGDIFESLAGAVYLDSGNNLNTVWRVFYNFMHKEIITFSQNIPKQPTRLLYEQIHASPKFMSSVCVDNGRVMVPLQFQFQGKQKIVHGFGLNKDNAKRSAAKIALKILGVSTP